jgi:hypothetical protein
VEGALLAATLHSPLMCMPVACYRRRLTDSALLLRSYGYLWIS